MIPDAQGVQRNIITEHGLLSKADIVTWATANIVNQQTRAAQDNHMLYQCLYESMDIKGRKRLIPKVKSTLVQNQPIAALYYKAIVSTVEVETKGSVTYIKKNLMNLRSKLETLNFNITEFHEYVNDQMTSLASHGKTSEDLTTYLFSAYDIVPDVAFKDTLARKEDDYT